MQKSLIVALVLPVVVSCSQADKPASNLQEAWNQANAPQRILEGTGFETKLASLPAGQKVLTRYTNDKLWTDTYWATYLGGITNRWADTSIRREKDRYAYEIMSSSRAKALSERDTARLSPAEKYDLLMGRYDFPLTKNERERTQVLTREDIPKWEGICHAWAPATLAYDNPKPVTMVNPDGMKVSFGSSDVKALLSIFLHHDNSARTYFLGERCNANFEEMRRTMSRSDYERAIRSSACRDTNAGSFHIVLTNQIGLRDQGFVADVTRDLEVWNQGIVGYDTTIVGRQRGASATAAPGTVEQVTVETKMYYISEVNQAWERQSLATTRGAVQAKKYSYVLELNAAGQIIGGEWMTEERPDFLWKSETPAFSGFFGKMKDLYEASTR